MGENPLIRPFRNVHKKASPRIVWSGFFCLIAVLVCASAGGAQPLPAIGSIAFRGNESIATNDLQRVFALQPGELCDSATLARSADQLEAFYRGAGFLFARAQTDFRLADSVVQLVVTIDEGLPTIVDSVSFTGNHHITVNEMMAVMEVRPGDRFVEALIEHDINSLLVLFEKRGFPTARISVGAIDPLKNETQVLLKIRFEVDEGVKATVDEILLEGNKATKDEVILREVTPRSSSLFNDDYAAGVRRSLERLRLFTSVETPKFFLSRENKGVMLIRVQEGNPNRFDGMIGYSPGSQGTGVVTGLADVQFGNLFGTGRRFSVRWMRESSTSQDLALRYFEPWVASFPIHLEIGFLQRRQDSTFIQRTYLARGTFSRRLCGSPLRGTIPNRCRRKSPERH